MNGFITKAWHGLCVPAGLLAFAGCLPCYQNVVDTCYPERYNAMARSETNGAFGTQVQNGHVLDQTIWNWYFEPGSSKLTPGGIDHLIYLARRRPAPDTTVYVQTSQDLTYNPAAPEQLVKARSGLDAERVASVQRFLAAETAGTPLGWNVLVHNPAPVGIHGVQANNAVRIWQLGTPMGVVPVGVGAAGSGGGGSSAGGASSGGAGGMSGSTGSF
jgi:hypothetical protein